MGSGSTRPGACSPAASRGQHSTKSIATTALRRSRYPPRKAWPTTSHSRPTAPWRGPDFSPATSTPRKGDGPVKKLASGLPGINSLAYRKDGRLYATQVFLGDALYEIDVEGVKPPRMITEKMGGLNGFEFGPDDKLYGPLWFKGQVAKVDVDKAELTVVADGFKIPAAVNFRFQGQSVGGRYRARPIGAGRSENRREEDGRAAEALAR